jgi:hypothetical protein
VVSGLNKLASGSVLLSHSQVKQDLFGVFDALLNLTEEQNSFTTINNTMIVG